MSRPSDKEIKTCVHDNPVNMRRECWQDGKLICSYDFSIFLFRSPISPVPDGIIFFGANIGEWRSGQIFGDPDAMYD